MPYFEFIWTDEIVQHIAEHGISTEDFQDVACHPEIQGTSRSSGRLAAWGHVSDGRFITAVYELIDDVTIIPVTAYEVHD